MRLDQPVPTTKNFRYLACSPTGFVQQLALGCVRFGYVFWVGGELPETAETWLFDYRMLNRYPMEFSKWGRWKRRQDGLANLRYLRYCRTWVLIARPGRSEFFDLERNSIRDIRESPFYFRGYSVAMKNGHAHVQISKARHAELKAEVRKEALRRSAGAWKQWFWELPYEPYRAVRQQAFGLLRVVNHARKAAGHEPLPVTYVRTRRRHIRPFVEHPLGTATGVVRPCPGLGQTDEQTDCSEG